MSMRRREAFGRRTERAPRENHERSRAIQYQITVTRMAQNRLLFVISKRAKRQGGGTAAEQRPTRRSCLPCLVTQLTGLFA